MREEGSKNEKWALQERWGHHPQRINIFLLHGQEANLMSKQQQQNKKPTNFNTLSDTALLLQYIIIWWWHLFIFVMLGLEPRDLHMLSKSLPPVGSSGVGQLLSMSKTQDSIPSTTKPNRTVTQNFAFNEDPDSKALLCQAQSCRPTTQYLPRRSGHQETKASVCHRLSSKPAWVTQSSVSKTKCKHKRSQHSLTFKWKVSCVKQSSPALDN